MTIEWKQILDNTLYSQLLYDVIKKFEGVNADPHLVEKVPHIGIGFNITENPARDAVILALGIDPFLPELNETQAEREVYYANLIRDALDPTKNTYSTNDALQSALNGIMYDRSIDSVYEGTAFNRPNTFQFSGKNDPQIKVAFDSIIGEYETRVNLWLGSTLVNSEEKAALVSMAYQGWIGFDKNGNRKTKALPLLSAIKNGDRAEAWYQIRYGINVEPRRYVEASMFGLYNSSPTEVDYKAAYRALTRHRDVIFGLDEAYGDGNDFEDQMYNATDRTIDIAIRWGDSTGATVAPIADEFLEAFNWLKSAYVELESIPVAITWDDIYVGEDNTTKYKTGTDVDTLTGTNNNELFFGESGNDTINAGSGDDVIYGGTGNDTLKGGAGNDYYVHEKGDGFDTITDSDGLGVLYLNDVKLTGGYQINETTYRSADQRFIYIKQSDGSLKIVDTKETNSGLIAKDFTDDTLGLQWDATPGIKEVSPFMYNRQADPEEDYSNTYHNIVNIVGTPGDDNSYAGVTNSDLIASPVTQSIKGEAGDDYIDGKSISGIKLYGGSGSDNIYGGDFWAGEFYLGDPLRSTKPEWGDWDVWFRDKYSFYAPLEILQPGLGAIIYGDESGYVSKSGENNNDVIYGSLRDDYIDAGPGMNFVEAYYGNDIVIGGNERDVLEGNEGNDYIDSGNGEDIITGGAGSDILIGGDDRDTIYGDSDSSWIFDSETGDLSLLYGDSILQIIPYFDPNVYVYRDVPVIHAGDDYIEGGGGIDEIFGGAGNDYIDGGDDRDFLEGEGGDDTILGGDGNDFIWGDAWDDPNYDGDTADLNAEIIRGIGVYGVYNWRERKRLVGEDGNDIIDGGSGDDQIWGGGGNDTYIFTGNYGNDVVKDEAGTADIIRLADGIERKDISFKKNGTSLLISYKNTVSKSDSITVVGYFAAGQIESIELSDGSVLKREDINKAVGLTPSAGNPDSQQVGDATVANNFFYALTDGVVEITDYSSPTALNTLTFATGITPDMITLREGSFALEVGGPDNVVHLNPFDPNDVYEERAVDVFKFADGTEFSYEQLLDRGFDYTGGAESNVITGTHVLDRIDTGAGDDVLYANGGNDILKGGSGDDTYIISSLQQDGFEIVIDDASGIDKLEFDISEYNVNIGSSWYDGTYGIAANIQYSSYDGNDLVLNMHMRPALDIYGLESYESFGTIRIKDYRLEGSIETIEASNRTILDQNYLLNTLQFNPNSYYISACQTDYDLAPYSQFGYYKNIDETLKVGNNSNNIMTVPTFSGGRAAEKNSLYGLGGNDTLNGSDRNDTLVGGSGNDTIYGGEGRDTLEAGSGSDQLYGGAGSDTYIIDPNDFNIISDDGTSGDSTGDRIQIVPGYQLADLQFTQDGNDLWINNTKITNFFHDSGSYADPGKRYSYMIEGLQTDDYSGGLTEHLIDLGMFGTITGTEGDDYLYGNNYQNYISGLDGRDYIYGNGGQDFISGGDGRDYVSGGYGDDTVFGGTGDDELWGNFGNDHIDGGDGHDRLHGSYESDILIGGAGDDQLWSDEPVGWNNYYYFNQDYLEGGIGNDTMNGGDDGDVFKYNLGDGYDLIADNGANRFLQNIQAIDAELAAIESAPDSIYTPLDQAAWDGGEWGISEAIYDGWTRVPGLDLSPWEEAPTSIVPRLAAVGDGATREEALAVLTELKEGYTDYQYDVIQFGAGISLGDINAYLSTSNPNNIVLDIAGEGGIRLNGLQIEILAFADGSRITLEDFIDNKTINNGENFGDQTGTDGNDLLIGSSFSEKLYGLDGDDYIIGNSRDIEAGGWNGDNQFTRDWLEGGAGNDVLVSSGAYNNLVGGSGDDILYDHSGTSFLEGGSGNDILVSVGGGGDLSGGDGSDVYLINPGVSAGGRTWGNSEWIDIEDWPDTLGGNDIDTISFGGGIRPDQILANIDYYDYGDSNSGDYYFGLVLLNSDTGDHIYIDQKEFYNSIDYEPGVERIQFLGNGNDQVFDIRALVDANYDALKSAGEAHYAAVLAARDAGVELGPDEQFYIPLFTPEAIAAFDITDQVGFAGGEEAVEYATTGKIEFPWTTGTPEADTLVGTSRADAINGLASDDTIYGLNGNDTITGGTGNDKLIGGSGNDTYIFNIGDGVDTIFDSNSLSETNIIQFGPGVNPADISLGLGSLLIRVGDQGDEIHVEGFDPDNPYAPTSIDYLRFDNGRIINYVNLIDRGFDLYGTDGDDSIVGTNAIDRIYGGAGNDIIEGRDGDDVLDGGTGNDLLVGGAGDDTYVFGPDYGHDVINAELGADKVNFGDGVLLNSIEVSQSGNDLVVSHGTGNSLTIADWFAGGSVVGSFEFADGTQLTPAEIEARIGIPADVSNSAPLLNGFLSDTQAEEASPFIYEIPEGLFTDPDVGDSLTISFSLIDGGPLPSWLQYDPSLRLLTGTPTDEDGGLLGIRVSATDSAGNMVSDEFEVQVTTLGSSITDGDDLIELDDGDNIVDGMGGNDTIRTFGGNDVLTGSTGDDLLEGGSGTDTYIFNLGDGVDTIVDSAGESNGIQFGPGILPGDLKLSYADTALIVSVGTSGDVIQIEGFDSNSPYVNSTIDLFEFRDGSSLSYSQLIDLGFDLVGTEGDDLINGTNAADRISGLGSNDILNGLDGNDTIDGGAGNDIIDAGEGNNVVTDLDGTANVTAGAGDDIITTGIGDDVINAGNGLNIVNAGEGSNTVTTGSGNDSISTASGNDIIDSGFGDDQIYAGDGNNTVNSAGGDNTIVTGSGDDLITTGSGNDTIDAGDGLNTINAGDGNNLVTTGMDSDVVTTGLGNDTILSGAGDDVINAGDGDDEITGGTGDDQLSGGTGNDTYYINAGDGIDTIVDISAAGEGNRIVFGAGITAGDLKLSYAGTTLVVSIGTSGDALHLEGFDSTNAYGSHAIETFEFSDGSTISYSQLIDLGFDLVGTDGDDLITGTNAADRISGLGGNDVINSLNGDDVIDGGAGDDIINAGEGNNVVADLEGNANITAGAGDDIIATGTGDDVIDAGDGANTVNAGSGSNTVITGNDNDLITTASGIDIIDSGAGNDVINAGDGNNTVNSVGGDNTIVTGSGDDQISTGAGNDTIDAGDGLNTINAGVGNNLVTTGMGSDLITTGLGDDTIDSGAGDDVINAGEGDNWINAGSGFDQLFAGSGNDFLSGGVGNDQISGGAGNDIYQYGMGDGLDWVQDEAGIDAIQFGDGINFDNTVVRYVDVNGVNTAQLRMLDSVGNEIPDQGMDFVINADGSLPIEEARFADGSVYSFAELVIEQRTHYGTKHSDSIITSRHDDTIFAGKGNDIVTSGSGHDVLWGEKGRDELYGQGGNDTLIGGKDKDLLDGGAGNDLLFGGHGKDALYGGNGNDVLVGGKDKDILSGGAGDDRIIIGENEDQILFGIGDGRDVVSQDSSGYIEPSSQPHHSDHSKNDHEKGHELDAAEVKFGEGITANNLWFQQTGENLVVSILGTNDSMTIEGWYAQDDQDSHWRNRHHKENFAIEEFETADGYELESENVELLVQAMAAFSPEAAASGLLLESEQASLDTAINSAWEYEDHHKSHGSHG